MIWPILEARADLQKYFCSFSGSNENFKFSFRDLLTFTYIEAFCPLPELHSLTSWVTFGIGFQIRCTAKYSSKRNEFAYDLWVWENAEIFPWEIFFSATVTLGQGTEFHKKLSFFWMQWLGKESPWEGLNFPMIVCLSINAR